jgi:hypothetical protein
MKHYPFLHESQLMNIYRKCSLKKYMPVPYNTICKLSMVLYSVIPKTIVPRETVLLEIPEVIKTGAPLFNQQSGIVALNRIMWYRINS